VEEMIMSDELKNELKNVLKNSRDMAGKIIYPIFIGSGLVVALWVNIHLLAEVLGPV
jgi:hypothetical protein